MNHALWSTPVEGHVYVVTHHARNFVIGDTLGRMGDDPELGLGDRLLEWWSSGREEIPQLGSAADFCVKAGSGRSFYSECCRSFVPGNLTAFIAYYAVIPFHHACRPCGRLYDHWRPPILASGRLPVSGRPRRGPTVRGYDDMAARSAFVISSGFASHLRA
ncbi:hypothetical protein GW17_00060959 [Ensete ventricosum]|nr:hypothetical protein GW17_00060959 [Ensete ventricosum]